MSVRKRFVMFLSLGFAMGAILVAALVGVAFGLGVVRPQGVPGALFWLVAAAVLAIGGAGTVWVSRKLMEGYSEAVEGIVRGIEQIAQGELQPRLPEDAAGELGEIVGALRLMCGQMKMIISQLTSLSSRVIEATEGAGDSCSEVVSGARSQSEIATRTHKALQGLREDLTQISGFADSISRRLEEASMAISSMDSAISTVANSVESLNANIEEGSRTTREEDRNVRALAGDLANLSSKISLAQGALHDVVEGAQQARSDARDAAVSMERLEGETARIEAAIRDVIKGSDAIHLSNERILEVTASLASRVDQVDRVIEVIRNLAERTKLLSINASIIASEAGEHGRAFAVVAHEVKDLAQSTAGAISEISKVVGGLKDGFVQTVETIERGQVDVDRGGRLAQSAVGLLRSIPEEVKKATIRNAGIVERTEKQVERGTQVEEIIGKVIGALGQVTHMLEEQVGRNERTLSLFGRIRGAGENVLDSTRVHAASSDDVFQTVNRIAADFATLAGQVRVRGQAVGEIIDLSDQVIDISRDNRGRAEALTSLIVDLSRYASYLGDDFRKIGAR